MVLDRGEIWNDGEIYVLMWCACKTHSYKSGHIHTQYIMVQLASTCTLAHATAYLYKNSQVVGVRMHLE